MTIALPHDAFVFACENLRDQLKGFTATSNISQIYGIPRGGLVVAVYLSHLIGIPVVTKLKKNDKWPHQTLVVDDICDTGKTLSGYDDDHFTAVIYYNISQSTYRPDFFVFDNCKQFVKFPWETSESAKVDYLE